MFCPDPVLLLSDDSTYSVNAVDIMLWKQIVCNGFNRRQRVPRRTKIALKKPWPAVAPEIDFRIRDLSKAVLIPNSTYEAALESRKIWFVGKTTLIKAWKAKQWCMEYSKIDIWRYEMTIWKSSIFENMANKFFRENLTVNLSEFLKCQIMIS